MKLLLAALVVLPMTARADAPACKAGGAIMVEVDKRHDEKSVVDTKVFGAGGWIQHVVRGDLAEEHHGCLTADQRAKLDRLVKSVPWKIETARITCKAMSLDSTVYTVAGKSWTQRLCGAEHLDDKSAKALAEIESIVSGLQ